VSNARPGAHGFGFGGSGGAVSSPIHTAPASIASPLASHDRTAAIAASIFRGS
jgi:hypothetical protein